MPQVEVLHVSEMSCWSSVFDKLIDCLITKNTTCIINFIFADTFTGTADTSEAVSALSLNSQSQSSSSDTALIPTEPVADTAPQVGSLSTLLSSPTTTDPAPREMTLENCQCVR